MLSQLYAKWMYAWETALTTRDQNRIERPLEWGFDYLADFGGEEAAQKVESGELTPLAAMTALNARIAADPHSFFDYATPTDFRIEQRYPELFPTNVRPETLKQEREYQRQAEVGELRREPFLRIGNRLVVDARPDLFEKEAEQAGGLHVADALFQIGRAHV